MVNQEQTGMIVKTVFDREIIDPKLENINGEIVYSEIRKTPIDLIDETYTVSSILSHPVGQTSFDFHILEIEHNGKTQEWSQFPFDYKFENELINRYFAEKYMDIRNIVMMDDRTLEEYFQYSKNNHYSLSETQIRHAVEEE